MEKYEKSNSMVPTHQPAFITVSGMPQETAKRKPEKRLPGPRGSDAVRARMAARAGQASCEVFPSLNQPHFKVPHVRKSSENGPFKQQKVGSSWDFELSWISW